MSADPSKRVLPRDFAHWLGPWCIGTTSWLDDAGALVERDHWMRPYREVSHCGTEGCCEMRSLKIGASVSPTRVVLSGNGGPSC